MNAKHLFWVRSSINVFDRMLCRAIPFNGVDVHSPDIFTFSHDVTRADILDIAISKDLPWFVRVESVADLSSDHTPLSIDFGSRATFSEIGLR